jgi:hypothetical protein
MQHPTMTSRAWFSVAISGLSFQNKLPTMWRRSNATAYAGTLAQMGGALLDVRDPSPRFAAIAAIASCAR